MGLIKDENTIRLDELTLKFSEASVLYQELEARIDDAALRVQLSNHAAAQRNVQTLVDGIRRARGELPQAGDPEHALIGAMGARLRAAVLPGEAGAHYVESLRDQAAEVSAALDEALATEGDPELKRVITEFKEANSAFEAMLRGRE